MHLQWHHLGVATTKRRLVLTDVAKVCLSSRVQDFRGPISKYILKK